MRGSVAHIGSSKQLQKHLTQQDTIQNAYWCMRSTPWSSFYHSWQNGPHKYYFFLFCFQEQVHLHVYKVAFVCDRHDCTWLWRWELCSYSLDLQPWDCNHSVGSFARFLRNLETPLILTNQVLFDVPDGLLFTREYCMGKENVCTDWKPHKVIPYLLCHFHPLG